MTTVFSGLARLRQTFFVAGVASRAAVSVRFRYGMVRSLRVSLASSAIMTAEASTQAFVVVMLRASLSH
jgi:hypothetical protein